MKNYVLELLNNHKKLANLYCPFCGEQGLIVKSDNEFFCKHCKSDFNKDDVMYNLDNNPDFQSDIYFKYITVSINYFDFSNSILYIDKHRINYDGKATLTRYQKNVRTNIKYNEETKYGHIKNLKELHFWVQKIRDIILTANDATVQPCDSGGVIESLVFSDFKISRANMWLSNGKETIFFLPKPEIIPDK